MKTLSTVFLCLYYSYLDYGTPSLQPDTQLSDFNTTGNKSSTGIEYQRHVLHESAVYRIKIANTRLHLHIGSCLA